MNFQNGLGKVKTLVTGWFITILGKNSVVLQINLIPLNNNAFNKLPLIYYHFTRIVIYENTECCFGYY